MLTADDVIDLLTLAAVYDQRTVGRGDVAGWLPVAQRQRWTVPAASRVIVEHYSAGADRPRINPAMITDRLRALRNQAAESFEAPRVPLDLPDRDYPVWLRERLAEHVDRVLARWADTGQDPPRALPAPAVLAARELPAAAPAEHRPAIASGIARMLARRTPRELDTRAQARAELARLREATS